MKYTDEQRLTKIYKYASELDKYIRENNVDEEKILNNTSLQWLITTPLYNIGEHVYNLSKEYKEAHGAIQWSLIAGVRHRLIHDYEGTNWNFITKIIFDDIPALLNQLEPMLKDEKK